MTRQRKRQGTTLKFLPHERRVLQAAARVEGIGWTTLARIKSVEWARRRLQRARAEKHIAASAA